MPSEQDDMVLRPRSSALTFDLIAKCSVNAIEPHNVFLPLIRSQTTKARASTLHLPHGPVRLPMFMPVATQASLKGLTPKQLEETSCRLCLNNTYHLLGPMLEVVASD
jgi:queuine tRNA-ribosyltransferase